MIMDLSEAKIILNENGYELLDEGKLGRAIGMGAFALGTLFGNANASYNHYNWLNKNIGKIDNFKKTELNCEDVFDKMDTKGINALPDDIDQDKCYQLDVGTIKIINKNYEVSLSKDYSLEQQIIKYGDKIILINYDKNENVSDLEVNYKNGNTISMWYCNNESETADTSFVKIIDKNDNGMIYMVDNYVIDADNINFNPDEEKIIYECPLKNGKQNGKGYTYDENGNLSQVDTYVNNKRNGKTIGYFPDGTEAFKIQYKDGKQVGHMVCSDGSRGRNITCYHP